MCFQLLGDFSTKSNLNTNFNFFEELKNTENKEEYLKNKLILTGNNKMFEKVFEPLLNIILQNVFVPINKRIDVTTFIQLLSKLESSL